MCSPENLDDQKTLARKAASVLRKAAHVVAGPNAAEDVAAMLLSSGAIAPGATVSGFLPIGSEIDPGPALAHLRAAGHPICLPCVVAPDTALIFRLWAPGDALVKESFGTRAPTAQAEAVEPDALLVPLLAFDAAGYRLGYGGGFYDRSLDALRLTKTVTAIGIAFSGQKAESVPRGPYDQPLDWIVTEAGAAQFTK